MNEYKRTGATSVQNEYETVGDAVVDFRRKGYELVPLIHGARNSKAIEHAYINFDHPGWTKIAFILKNGSEVFGRWRKL